MRVSIIQTGLVWEDKPANLRHIGELLKPLYNKTDIVVLPEMFNTGFALNPGLLSESPDSETFRWMIDKSKIGKFGLCGSYIIKENEEYFNRWVFVSPEGEMWTYDKRHLFSMAGEDKAFSKGNNRLVFTFREVRISPYICYDLRFPVWSRNRNDCDFMIYSANWPESRKEIWTTLLRARAIENQCYVAGANIIGTDGNDVKYSGDSMLISPRGEVIASASPNEECYVSADLSMTELNAFRKKFPVSNDADHFIIE